MDNIYLVYGDDEYLINHNINKIIKKHNDYNVIYYDLEHDLLDTLVDEANTLGLFGKKLIVCKNAKFLSRQQSNTEQNIDNFMLYLDNINEDVIIIITNETIDNAKKIVKKLKEVANVVVCNKLDNHQLYNMLIKKFNNEGYKIEDSAVKKIIDLTLSDMNLINSEINKLLMYKLDDKIITLNNVEEVVSEKLDDNIFELIDAVVDNNKNKIFSIYSKLINNLNYEPTKILIMIANQFRLILKTKVMIQNNMSEKEIATILKIHPYRIKLANQKSKKIDMQTLKNYLLDLSEIDYKIKSGLANKNASLELFFINL